MALDADPAHPSALFPAPGTGCDGVARPAGSTASCQPGHFVAVRPNARTPALRTISLRRTALRRRQAPPGLGGAGGSPVAAPRTVPAPVAQSAGPRRRAPPRPRGSLRWCGGPRRCRCRNNPTCPIRGLRRIVTPVGRGRARSAGAPVWVPVGRTPNNSRRRTRIPLSGTCTSRRNLRPLRRSTTKGPAQGERYGLAVRSGAPTG